MYKRLRLLATCWEPCPFRADDQVAKPGVKLLPANLGLTADSVL